MKRTLLSCLLFGVISMLIMMPMAMAAQPFGASVSEQGNETAPADAAGTQGAIAGNVSEIDLTGFSTTQSWQGYYGNVSGTIQLADANDNQLYNWTLADPEGEVYASTNDSVIWNTIHCFNFSASGNLSAGAEPGNAGDYHNDGLNLSQLESNFSIVSDDVDGVNETFNLLGAGTHDLFYTNNLEFSEGECQNTRVYGDTGGGVNDEFEEALLYDSTTQAVVFSSILEETSTLGFDDLDHDFQMLVLEDGHGTDTSTTTYYFYVELE